MDHTQSIQTIPASKISCFDMIALAGDDPAASYVLCRRSSVKLIGHTAIFLLSVVATGLLISPTRLAHLLVLMGAVYIIPGKRPPSACGLQTHKRPFLLVQHGAGFHYRSHLGARRLLDDPFLILRSRSNEGCT